MRRTLLGLTAILLLGAAAPAADAPAKAAAPNLPTLPTRLTLVFGIGTPNGEEHAIKAKGLIEPYLSKALGGPVKVRVFSEYADLAAALPTREVDAAWLTPIAFARARIQSDEVKPLLKARRNGKNSYRTAYIVRKDSPAKTLDDLQGKRVAWVSPGSASGYIFARALLSWAGYDPDGFFSQETFAGTHPAVCKAVREGAVDVGATLADPPLPGKEFEANGCEDSPPVSDFRVLAASEPIPNDVIAVGPRIGASDAAKLADVFKKMADTAEGKSLMTEAFRIEAWGPVAEKDFDTAIRILKPEAAKKKGKK